MGGDSIVSGFVVVAVQGDQSNFQSGFWCFCLDRRGDEIQYWSGGWVVGGRVGGISGGSRRKGGSTSKIKSIEKFKTKYAN